MYRGFYEEMQKRQCDYFTFMENIETGFSDVLGTNLYMYIHGYCDSFACALNEIYGYDIFAVIDSETKKLIHAYCGAVVDGKSCFVDVRGVTDDIDLFFREFEDEFDVCQDEGFLVKQFKNQSEFLRYFDEATPIAMDVVKKLKENHEFNSIYKL